MNKFVQMHKARMAKRLHEEQWQSECIFLQLRKGMSDDEKLDAIQRFTNRLFAIDEYDLYVLGIW